MGRFTKQDWGETKGPWTQRLAQLIGVPVSMRPDASANLTLVVDGRDVMVPKDWANTWWDVASYLAMHLHYEQEEHAAQTEAWAGELAKRESTIRDYDEGVGF